MTSTVIDFTAARTLRATRELQAIVRKQKRETNGRRVRVDARLAAFLEDLTDARDNAPDLDRPCDTEAAG